MPLAILKVIRDGISASMFISVVDYVLNDNTPICHEAHFVRRGDAEEIRRFANLFCDQGIVELIGGNCYRLMNSKPIWGDVA